MEKRKTSSNKVEVKDLNNFFVTIEPQFSKKNEVFKYYDRITRNCETFVFFPTDIDEMAEAIKKLKTNIRLVLMGRVI